MPELKLAKLPDRVPVELVITIMPELALALREYAAVYKARYGCEESIEDLVPFMLAGFLESDKAFAKARRDITLPPVVAAPVRRRRRGATVPAGDAK